MGCLNSTGTFEHWFANIHLSGPCNRSCYFCIGQHMMDLDPYNMLDTFPLPGLDNFIDECISRGINEVNMTGTNTDPLLYTKTWELKQYLLDHIPNLVFGIRTNAVKKNLDLFELYDVGSVTICSFEKDIYRQMMGKGSPPDFENIIRHTRHWQDLKINIVLGEENVNNLDILRSIDKISKYKVEKINLREPYGQPHVGNPLESMTPDGTILGNPYYMFGKTMVTYWDVHYTHVESVNLYANGRVSTDYPITRGHSPNGEVKDQSNFTKGRHREQWIY